MPAAAASLRRPPKSAAVTVAANGTAAGTIDVNSLTVESTGQLDISNNKMIVRNGDLGVHTGSTYTGILKALSTGRNGGTWNGKGIITSHSAAQGPGFLKTIAAARAGAVGKANTIFGGQNVNANDVILMYTYTGDANLSGFIDVDDYFAIDSNYGKTGSAISYTGGDFNYSGLVDGDDYFLIDANFGAQTGVIDSVNADLPAGVTAVPEPTSLALLSIAATALYRRRRPSR